MKEEYRLCFIGGIFLKFIKNQIRMKKGLISMGVLLAFLTGCTPTPSQQSLTLSGLDPSRFEKMIDETKPVKLFTLKNEKGMEVCITNFGARIVSIMVPDKNGKMTDVVLGFDNIEDYIHVPTISVLPSDAMPTVSDKEKLPSTDKKSNCLKTTSSTAFTEVLPVGNIKFSRLIRQMTRPSS